jgi:hypothetical protein
MLNNLFKTKIKDFEEKDGENDQDKEKNLRKEIEEKLKDLGNKHNEVLSKHAKFLSNDTSESIKNTKVKALNNEYLQKKRRKEESKNTLGKDWFDMKVPEMTPEIRQDLKALQLRNIIDPSRFYKKMDRKTIPKFFQIGKVEDNILDGKASRMKKSEVKSRFAEEILEADKIRNFTLNKFNEIQEERRKMGKKKLKMNKFKLKNWTKSRKSEFIIK